MFPLVPVPSTRYPSASALLLDESFQLFIKILRGHVQGMFVYTPPSWHPVLCSATPSGPGRSREEEGQRELRGSFIHRPSLAAQPRCFPQEFTAGSGRKRPRDIPCVAAIWCLSPPPAVPPTHKFTRSWRGASSTLWEFKPKAPPRGLCEKEPARLSGNSECP